MWGGIHPGKQIQHNRQIQHNIASLWAAGATGLSQVARSPVQVVSLDVGGDLSLPLVPIVEQFLLVVQQLLMCLSGELKVGALQEGGRSARQPPPGASVLATSTGPTHLHNGVNRAGLLAEATVDTLGHVDVVACSPAAAIGSWLSLNGDGLREWSKVTATGRHFLAQGRPLTRMPTSSDTCSVLQREHPHMAPVASARVLFITCPGDPPVSQGKGYHLLRSFKTCGL